MSSPNQTSFNLAAEKVVALKELKQKTDALYKTELSFGDKCFLYLVDRPASIVVALISAVKGSTPKKGAYVDMKELRMYGSGEFIMNSYKHAPFTLSKAFDQKTLALTQKAFEQCTDHSQLPVMSRLQALDKPLKM